MRFDNYTYKAQEAVEGALGIARDYSHQHVSEMHLLLALLRQEDGVLKAIFEKLGISPKAMEEEVVSALSKVPKVDSDDMQVYFSNSLQVLFKTASKEAAALKDEYVSSEHLGIALSESKDAQVSALFKKYGAGRQAILSVLKEIRGSQNATDQNAEEKYRALEKYTRDITELARREKLDPVIGRDSEIRRTIQVLSRRTKNNPVLIGEAGTGKTAIVEGLARRIAYQDVPSSVEG